MKVSDLFLERSTEVSLVVALFATVLLGSCSFDALFPAERYKEAFDRASREEQAGDIKGAERSYLDAIKCAELLDREKTAMAAKRLGWLYSKTGRYDLAKAQFTTSLNVYQSLWKEGEGGLRNRSLGTELSDTMHGLANLHRTAGRFAEADALYVQALQSVDPGLGSHKDQNQIMMDYAASLRSQHKDDLAAKLERQSQDFGAVEGTTGSSASRDPEQLVADGKAETGALNYDKAEGLYQAAIDKLGDNPTDRENQILLTRAYLGLAQAYDAKKNYPEAKTTLAKALVVTRKNQLKVELPDVLERVAAVELHSGELEKSVAAYKEALEVQAERDNRYDTYFRQSRRLMESLSGVYIKMKKFKEAEALLNRKTELELLKYGAKTSKVAPNYCLLAQIADLSGDIDKAIKLYEKAIFVLEHAKKDRARETFLAYDEYTKFLLKHGKLELAKKYQLKMAHITNELAE